MFRAFPARRQHCTACGITKLDKTGEKNRKKNQALLHLVNLLTFIKIKKKNRANKIRSNYSLIFFYSYDNYLYRYSNDYHNIPCYDCHIDYFCYHYYSDNYNSYQLHSYHYFHNDTTIISIIVILRISMKLSLCLRLQSFLSLLLL